MPVTALLGLQWGDEGKGKVVDVLAGRMDVVVRAQGGANAGHTVKVGDKTRVLHLVPSGILMPNATAVIGNGVVLDGPQLLTEIDELEASGASVTGRLKISDRAHLVLPYHKELDVAMEASRGERALGTTRRGIGPAYMDRASRTGIRVGELRHPEEFRRRIVEEIAAKSKHLAALGHAMPDTNRMADDQLRTAERLLPMVIDSVDFLLDALDRKREILIEGAQGALLDVDLGTYPFVTSSNCHLGGLLSGSGLPATSVTRVIGVAKAYCTRVGSGPFPSEDRGRIGDELRTKGREFGATTGRPRRCGWFDAVAVRYAVRTNGVSEIVLTKSDVLAGQKIVKVLTHYEIDGRKRRDFPAGQELDRATPVYREFQGFDTDLSKVRSYSDLPASLRETIDFMEQEVGARVAIVSTGPERAQTLFR